MKNKIQIYTDGSSLGNPGKGGWGAVIVRDNTTIKELGDYNKNTTNNQMELSAAIHVLKYIKKNKINSDILIHTDSAYVLGGVTSWVFSWEKNGWKTSKREPVLNQDLWKELILLTRDLKNKIIWQKVKGHSGDKYNDRADEIATGCANLQQKHIL